MISFFVKGIPRPKGSPRPVRRESGRTFITLVTSDGAKWQKTVVQTASYFAPSQPISGPVFLILEYRIPIRKSRSAIKKRKYGFCYIRPDIDKLERLILDALQRASYFQDDSRVCMVLHWKTFVDEINAGVSVRVFNRFNAMAEECVKTLNSKAGCDA